MKQAVDINNWSRRDLFNFFSQFEEPFFGVCVNIDCTTAYRVSKQNGFSFFLYYLYQSLAAANHIDAFRYRISANDVFIYDSVHASTTINRPDGTFGFAYIDYKNSFAEFTNEAATEIKKVQSTSGLVATNAGENVIHYSSIPWVRFTSLSHARSFSFKDSIPKISFGKMTEEGGKNTMPVSIHVHHALADGYHVGQFVDYFQELMNQT